MVVAEGLFLRCSQRPKSIGLAQQTSNLSLYQMQIRALAESMTSLSQEIESKGMNEYRLAALHILQRRLGNIIKSAEATQKSLDQH